MKKKHDLPPVPDRPPPMFVGDAVSEPLLPARTQGAGARPADDPRVVLEGTGAGRLLIIALGLLAVLGLDLAVTGNLYNLEGQILLIGGPVVLLAWLVNRDLVRRRREFRLRDGGITVEVHPLTGGPPRTVHVPWTEIADYTLLEDSKKAFLQVVSVRGYTFTLKDHPPRPSTREFLRAFVEQAARYPRAVEPGPRGKGSRLPDVTGEREPLLGGCMTTLVFVLLASAVEAFLEPSVAQQLAAVAAMSVIGFPVYLWWTLDDPEIAASDAKSKRLIARLRRWLRRVLGTRVS